MGPTYRASEMRTLPEHAIATPMRDEVETFGSLSIAHMKKFYHEEVEFIDVVVSLHHEANVIPGTRCGRLLRQTECFACASDR